MKRTRIKVCGICSVDDALMACEAGCDAIGLVFYKQSPRSVTIDQAREISQSIPAFINKIALFVDAEKEEVDMVVRNVFIDTLQFHGSEGPEYCRQFGKPYIKALSFSEQMDEVSMERDISRYDDAASILLDSFDEKSIGGTGTVFDWDMIPENVRENIILAGGLEAENVSEAIKAIKPFAVDVSSGVEKLDAENKPVKGVKDRQRLAAFIQAVRTADENL